MSLADDLATRLATRPFTNGVELVGWCFDVAEQERLGAGLEGGRLGGPYQPPRLASRVGGRIDLRWSDGLRTVTSPDRRLVDELPSRLAAWREHAIRDPAAAPIPGPRNCPEVWTADPRVDRLVGGDPTPLLALLGRIRSAGLAHGMPGVDATARAGRGTRQVLSSAGLRIRFPETSCSLTVGAEDLYEANFARRRLPRDDELTEILDRVLDTVVALRTEEELPPRSIAVLFTPEIVEDLVGRVLGAALAGGAVLEGRSAFRLDDFRGGSVVVREDLDVVVDTTLPLELATSPCSSEGVPGGRVALLAAGRLVTPTLGASQALRCGLPATPVPRGAPRLLLQPTGGLLTVEDAWGRLRPGLVVSFVMGLHVQAARTGGYAVVAPQAQLVQDGSLRGRVGARLVGNVFRHLRDGSAIFVRFPHALNPGLLLVDGVAITPA